MSKTDLETTPQANGAEGVATPPSQGAVRATGDFVRDHPLLVVAGGIAIGAVVAALLPRGTGRRVARRAVQLAEVAGTASALLGSRAKDAASAAGEGLREQGGVLAEKLERLGETASDRLGQARSSAAPLVERLIDPVENAALKAAEKVSKKASELRSRVRH